MIESNLKAIVPFFDAFFVDQFGVLLDGNGAIHGAIDALSWLSEQGKPIVLLSNSGKRSRQNELRLSGYGFHRHDYIKVMSSGEAAYEILSNKINSAHGQDTKVWAHSRDSNLDHIAGLDIELTQYPENADLLILSGVQSDLLTLREYETILRPAVDRQVLLLCSNPDFEMLLSTGIRFSAGRVAKLYEDMGGTVQWIGKPYPLLYSMAADLVADIAPSKILCIGDSPAHDIVGGRNAGYKTALVRTGIHAQLNELSMRELCRQSNAMPDFIIPNFSIAREGS